MSVRFHYKYPLVFTAIFAVLGVALSVHALILITLLLGIISYLKLIGIREYWIIFQAIWLGFGSLTFQKSRYKIAQNDISRGSCIQVEIESINKTQNGIKVIAKNRSVYLDSNWVSQSDFKVQWLQIEDLDIIPGCLVLLQDYKFRVPKTNKIPISFNEYNYFMGLGILGNLDVSNSRLYALDMDSASLDFQRYNLKKNLMSRMSPFFSSRSFALFLGLLLGDKSYLESQDKQLFQRAGLMHILSVSGMHIGLIYWLISWPISILGKRYYAIKKFEIALIPVLWAYAHLTGMAPPVLRATAFISVLMVLRILFKRKVRLPDLIASSACLFVIFSPLEFYSVSFQLSFAAMLGIAFWFPLWQENWRKYLNRMNGVGDLLGMSLCCTFTTLPLTLYHFHQIPTWFLLGNLTLTLPLTFLIYVFSAHVLFAWLDVEFITKFISYLVEFLVDFIYQGLALIEALPLPFLFAYDFGFVDALFLSILIVMVWRYAAKLPILSKDQIVIAVFIWVIIDVLGFNKAKSKVQFDEGIRCSYNQMPGLIKWAQAHSNDTLYVSSSNIDYP